MIAGTLVDRPRTMVRLGVPDATLPIFIPLGFVDGPRPATMSPIYPPGFPAHMALFALIGGWQHAPFLVTVFAAVLCLPLIYLFGRELALPPGWSLAAAVLFAAWPVAIGQAIQPMSDAAATLWCLASMLSAVKARHHPLWALPAGAALGTAVLVRPTDLLLLVPLVFALPFAIRPLLLFAAGGLPFAAGLAVYDRQVFGNALQSGYRKGGLLEAIALSNFLPRVRHYGGWILRTLTPLVPLAWLGVAADRKASRNDRAMLLCWFSVFFLFYCLYEPYDSFWFVRFLLPGAPALILGAVVTAHDLFEGLGRRRVALGAAAAMFAAVLLVEVRSLRNARVLGTAEYESIYPRICRWAAGTVPKNAVVLSMAASGALEYYTDLSYARWDWLTPERFGQLRPFVDGRGSRWFALLFPFERDDLEKHTPGRWRKIGQLREVGLYELEP